jgi:hypothetical protein
MIKLRGGFPCLFHVTSRENAESVLSAGFHDGKGDYGFRTEDSVPLECSGVWPSKRPLDANEGAHGDAVLEVQFNLPLVRLDEFENVEKIERNYREWLIPAAFISEFAIAALAD